MCCLTTKILLSQIIVLNTAHGKTCFKKSLDDLESRFCLTLGVARLDNK